MTILPTVDEFPPLSPEEKKLSMAKYYYRPLVPLDPGFERPLEAGPLKADEIPLPEEWWKLVRAEGYNDSDWGYGELEEGAGYVATYTVSRFGPPKRGWWFQWMQVAPKSMPEGKGNLCYKMWFPPDHFNHTPECGTESLDLGKGDLYKVHNYNSGLSLGSSQRSSHWLAPI